MRSKSRILPILDHLAWLADRIEDPIRSAGLREYMLLTYNAAVMLQFRFVVPLSPSDEFLGIERQEIGKQIDSFVSYAEKAVEKVVRAPEESNISDCKRCVARTRKLSRQLSHRMRSSDPSPNRMRELEAPPNIRELLGEALATHANEHADAIAKGKHIAAKGGIGPYKAVTEALAELAYVCDRAGDAGMPPNLRRPLTQMAAGFLKTAVEIKSEDFSPALKRRLVRRAETLITSATPSKP